MSLSPRMEVELRRRWKELEPHLLASLKSQPRAAEIVSQMMDGYRALHRDAVERCMSLGIKFLRIRKWSLDDPTISDSERGERIAKFKRSQARRPGPPNKRMGQRSYHHPAPIYPGDL